LTYFPFEDGHAQERSLLNKVLLTIKPNDVWVADRNFCTLNFTSTIASKQAYFIIREHKNYPIKHFGEEKYIGKIDTGKVYEQSVTVVNEFGEELVFRRICLKLKETTRDGEKEIAIITNLSEKLASARKITELYRSRWTIETAFQYLAEYFNSEINTLGYPRAALFGFCVALVSYIILSVIKAALGGVHGTKVIENQVSGYYIADEISGTYRAMMIAISDKHWAVFEAYDDI